MDNTPLADEAGVGTATGPRRLGISTGGSYHAREPVARELASDVNTCAFFHHRESREARLTTITGKWHGSEANAGTTDSRLCPGS